MPLPSALPPGDLKAVTIFTDGACSGNPGPGAYAAILVYGGHRRELAGGFRRTTNNRMELTGAIRALEALKEPCSVTLVSDSMYVINGIAKGWARSWRAKHWVRQGKTVPNWDLWRRLLELCEHHEVRMQWVEGHAGHAENERCDELAVEAAAGDHLEIDGGYESMADYRNSQMLRRCMPWQINRDCTKLITS